MLNGINANENTNYKENCSNYQVENELAHGTTEHFRKK